MDKENLTSYNWLEKNLHISFQCIIKYYEKILLKLFSWLFKTHIREAKLIILVIGLVGMLSGIVCVTSLPQTIKCLGGFKKLEIFFIFLQSVCLWSIGWIVLVFSYKYFKRNNRCLLLFCLVSVFSFVVYSFLDCSNYDNILLKAIVNLNNTLSSFFPSRGDLNLDEVRYKYPYVIFHSVIYLTLGILTMSYWGEHLYNATYRSITLDANQYVFWCKSLEQQILLLGNSIYHDDKTPERANCEIVIEVCHDDIENKEMENRLYDDVNKKKFLLSTYDSGQISINSLYARYHFFITNEEDWNMLQLIKLLDQRQRNGIHNKIDIYLKVGHGEKKNELYEKHLMEKYCGTLDADNSITIHVINEEEIVARDFINQYPPILSQRMKIHDSSLESSKEQIGKLKKGSCYRILILGFGWQGHQILKYSVVNSQFLVDGQDKGTFPFSADIIDIDKKSYEQYSLLRKKACEDYNLNFFSIDVLSSAFLDFLKENMKGYDRIIITLGNKEINFKTYVLLLNLKKLYRCKNDLQIFIRRENDNDCMAMDHVLGNVENIYTVNNILSDNIDKMAKVFHAIWKWVDEHQKADKGDGRKEAVEGNEHKHEMETYDYFNSDNESFIDETWTKATIFEKYKSRASAEGLRNILNLLGYKIIDHKPIYDEDKEVNNKCLEELTDIINNKKIIMTLAETEHLRWNAFELMRGIVPWEVNSHTTYLEAMTSNFKANQEENFNRHADIVSFDDLPIIDAKFDVIKEEYLKIFKDCCMTECNRGQDTCVYDKEIGDIINSYKTPKPPSRTQDKDIEFINKIPLFVNKCNYSLKQL